MIPNMQKAGGSARGGSAAAFLLVASVALLSSDIIVGAFQAPPTVHHNQIISSSWSQLIGLQNCHARRRGCTLRMEREEVQSDHDDDAPDAAHTSPSIDDDDDEDDESHQSKKAIHSYKSGLNAQRVSLEARPGSSIAPSIDVTMKFGGSSLANAERVDRVANLIKDRIHPPPPVNGEGVEGEVPVRPRAGAYQYI